jgi:hypothetical protein
MADDTVTKGDKGDPTKQPIKDPEVYVDATTGENGSRDATRKVEEQVKRDIRKAIDDAADQGSKKQLEAAETAAEKAAEQISPGTVEDVEVYVSGEVNGEPLEHEIKIKPKD